MSQPNDRRRDQLRWAKDRDAELLQLYVRIAMEHQANMVEHVGAMREHAAKQQTLAAEMQAAEQQRLAKQTAAAIMPAPKQGPP